jgi:hypothetical protein
MSTKCEHKTMNNAVLCTVTVLPLRQIGPSKGERPHYQALFDYTGKRVGSVS